MKANTRKFLRQVFLMLGSLVLCTGLLEISFRYYIFPFYHTEFTWENSPAQPPGGILIAGDSYTALPHSFAFRLRDSLHLPIHICAVPGTGIREALAFLPDEINSRKPSEIWYQVYIGNDFLDIRHPVNLSMVSPMRNTYWWISDRIISLKYLNYKLGGLGHRNNGSDIKSETTFTPESYNFHERLFLQADPLWLLQLNQTAGDQVGRIEEWEDYFIELQSVCTENSIPLRVILIPHPAQVGALSREQMVSLGGANGDYEYTAPLQLRLHTFLDSRKVAWIDLKDVLTERIRHDSSAVYFPADPHLTPLGNEIITNALLGWYKQGGVP